MAAHRYWRATAFETYGGGELELSEFHLLAGGIRLDATATLTASVVPDVSGSLTNLQDDVLTTAARWSAQAVKGLTLQWDFDGSPANVVDIRLSGRSEERFPLILLLQWSDDESVWFDHYRFAGVAYPGALTKTSSALVIADAYFDKVGSLLHFDGVAGSSSFPDSVVGNSWVATNVVVSADYRKFGTGSAFFNGSNSDLAAGESTNFDLGSGDFTVELVARFATLPASAAISALSGCYKVGTKISWLFYLYNSGGAYSFTFDGSTDGASGFTVASAAFTPVVNTLYHLAVSRTSGLLEITVDGAVIGSATSSHNFAATVGSPLRIGSYFSGGVAGRFHGSIDEYRLTAKNKSRYSGNFTSPPAAFPDSGNFGPANNDMFLNKTRGRASTAETAHIGGGVALDFGYSAIDQPVYFGVESGSVKDQITGVLGEGIGRVKGTVATKGSPNQPVHRKVRLIRDRDGLVIRETWSNATTGEYDFQWVDEAQTFTVVSYDHLHNYRAVIADNLVPELMP